MQVVIYLRVSGESQLDGYGLDVQEKACRAYAEARNWEVVRVIPDEAVSGALPVDKRPGLRDVLDLLGECPEDECADVLLAGRLDRLAREATVQEAILAQVWKLGADVHTVDYGEVKRDDPDDPVRTAIRQMMGVFSQLDRAMIVKRLRDGRKAKAHKGGHAVGSYRYGYDRSGVVPQEQETLLLMRDLRGEGRTLQQVVDELNTRGIRTRNGRLWTIRTVDNILRRKVKL